MSAAGLNYNVDGANRQAQAALAYFQYLLGDGIESSWNDKWKQYDAVVHVARWENCREQGYVLMLRNKSYSNQLNIAFFEHRNVDSLCALRWEQRTMNSPTIATADFGEAYVDKYDTTFDVAHSDIVKMAEYLRDEFINWWKVNNEES